MKQNRKFAQKRIYDTPSWLKSSWLRSHNAGLDILSKARDIRLDRVSLEKQQTLKKQLISSLEERGYPLFKQLLKQTRSRLILSNEQGDIIRSFGTPHFAQKMVDVALDIGVNWSEINKGTNAIGTALEENRLISVVGEQHYLSRHNFLSCTACPVYDSTGQLLGVVDITTEEKTHNETEVLLVKSIVHQVEMGLLCAVPKAFYRLDIASSQSLIDSVWTGTIVIAEDGQILAANRSAQKILEQQYDCIVGKNLEDIFSENLSSLNEDKKVSYKNKMLLLRPTRLSAFKRSVFVSSNSNNSDPAFEKAWKQACQIINEDIPLLVSGESGVGKEQFVKALHRFSERSNKPMITVDCGSLPSGLIESELFGYTGGAFTDANRAGYLGKIRQADGGILFLDEIGNMPLSAQSLLLRVLQEREVMPIGSNEVVTVDIRVVAATHVNLDELINKKLFREDLYYRLSGLLSVLPPLRKRKDIRQLIHCLHQKYSSPQQIISVEVLDLLLSYHWPGNLRELDNLIKVVCFLSKESSELKIEHFPESFLKRLQGGILPTGAKDVQSIKHTIQNRIVKALEMNKGNISKAAQQLGVSRNTVYRKLKKYN